MDSIIAYSPKKTRWPALEETTSKCKQFMSFHSPGSGQCEGYFFFDHAQELAMDIHWTMCVGQSRASGCL